MAMKFRKKLLLAGVESSYGVDPGLTGASNAILTRDLAIQTFEGNTEDLTYDRPTMGGDKTIYTGPHTIITFTTDLAGSGMAGLAPAWSPLIRGCNFVEGDLALAEDGPAFGATSTTITLDTGVGTSASAVDDFYNGYSITITAGPGVGQTRKIVDYVGSTKVATVFPAFSVLPTAASTYSIPEQVKYTLTSEETESLTLHFLLDGELHKVLGARGTFSLDLTREQLPKINWTFTGLRVAPATGAASSVNLASWIEPLPANKVSSGNFTLLGYSSCLDNLQIDLANTVTYRNLISCETVDISDRDTTGSVSIEKPTLAKKDYDAEVFAHTQGGLSLTHGKVAGNIVDIYGRVQLTQPEMEDVDGIVHAGFTLNFVPSDAGNDELSFNVR